MKVNEYKKFLSKLKSDIIAARYKAYQAVNKQLVGLYLHIGRGIYEKIEISKWGEGIVEKLSRDLQTEFSDMKGFTSSNLWRMKQLYETYKDSEKLATLLRELPWSHNLLILHHTQSMEEKEFYLKTCINERWSYRELKRQIDSSLFERFMLSRKTGKLIPHTKEKNALKPFKDEYMLDFLGLKEDFSEKDLRRAIVRNLKQFFLEFGKYFTFVGEEYKVTVGDSDFKVDLLFYHRFLKCLVAVELKIGEFKPEYIGKMQFYISALDEKEKLQGENPTVGLILCKSKDHEVVRIALSAAVSPLKVSTYRTKIIDRKLLRKKLQSLPSPENSQEESDKPPLLDDRDDVKITNV